MKCFLCFAHVCFLIRRQQLFEMNLKNCYVASLFRLKVSRTRQRDKIVILRYFQEEFVCRLKLR